VVISRIDLLCQPVRIDQGQVIITLSALQALSTLMLKDLCVI
jgi:hypothetical protein